MRVKTFFRVLRLISAVVLFFFVWTYLPLYSFVAYAAEKKQGQERQGQGSSSKGQGNQEQVTKVQGSGERFEKALESIREHINRAEEKSRKGEEPRAEIETIRNKKAELESIDSELKTEFAATEKKLKDANLPGEILERHHKFVKHYQDNLKELIGNLDQVEKAQTRAEVDRTVKKAKLHLEKTKPPKRHKALDPNKLPHRMVKAKEKAPRLKKEEFERDFPQHKTKSKQKIADNRLLPDLHANRAHKPILLAFNDSVSDIPLQLPRPIRGEGWGEGAIPIVAFSDSSPFLLAQQTVDLPTPEDLAETVEVQFTPEIRAKAEELGKNPVKIYNWVRNNIAYQPYYGSFKGPAQTLVEGAGNDFDQASLLIALLRVSNIAAKYSYGTVEIPIDKVKNWVGGISDPKIAGMILSSQGIPAKLMKTGSVYTSVQMEHVWVEAWIDYIPSRGAVHMQGNTWIPLDPSFKQYTYKQGMDMYALMGFNADEFLISYVTDTRNITAYQDYSMRMLSFLDANYPDASVEDVLGASEIKLTKNITMQELPFLLGTLPYKVVVKAAQFSQAPVEKDYTISIQIEGDSNGLMYTNGLNYLSDKRITVSYDPATQADETILANAGGNVFAVPPYIINVKPILRVNGVVVAAGDSIGLGKDQSIVINFAGPDGDSDRIENVIIAGNYSAIILQSQDTPVSAPSKHMAKLIENSKNNNLPTVTIDDLLGQALYSIGVSYFHTLSFENEVFAKTMQLVSLRQPSEAMVTQEVKVDYLFGLPRAMSAGGIGVDVDRNVNAVYSPEQDKAREKAFMTVSGLSSSVTENRILEAFFDVPSVSAVRLLKIAAERGVPIYTITNSNVSEMLSQLQVGGEVKADVANAVNAGKTVIVPKTDLTLDQWVGVGYIIRDPNTGAGSYMISGGLNGSKTDKTPIADANFKATWADNFLSKIVRFNVINFAISLHGTMYGFGCKDPDSLGKCNDKIDCSGLTSLSYAKAGIPWLGDGKEYKYRDAQGQYDYSLKTDDPVYGDLVFFQGSYDKNCDGTKGAEDGVTHVGIYRSPGVMIHASALLKIYSVVIAPISDTMNNAKSCTPELICLKEENGVCAECKCSGAYNAEVLGGSYNSFVGYGKIIP